MNPLIIYISAISSLHYLLNGVCIIQPTLQQLYFLWGQQPAIRQMRGRDISTLKLNMTFFLQSQQISGEWMHYPTLTTDLLHIWRQ